MTRGNYTIHYMIVIVNHALCIPLPGEW